MKILEICPYSAGICGVWTRVLEESKRLSKKGFSIKIFSSNFEKGSDKKVGLNDKIENLEIQRFPAVKLGGESFMHFDFKKEAIEYSPDIIIVHNYRHLHTTQSLNIAKKLRKKGKKCKVFLVTHAPFPEGDITRSAIAKMIVKLYDAFIGPLTLNKFDKILTISNWETKFLIKAGAKKERIVYLPNGIPDEFFAQGKSKKEEHKVLFLGRVSPKKKIETLVEAIPHLKDKKVIIEVVGPKEEEYYNKIKELIKKNKVENRVKFSEPIYNLKKKIEKIDSAKIYVLASRVEGMPQSLVEAMARGKIVIGSNSLAIKDLIKDKENGFLFEFNNPKDLAEKIDLALKSSNKKIKENAQKSVREFRWNNILEDYIKIINAFQ